MDNKLHVLETAEEKKQQRNQSMAEEAKANGKSSWRGHPIIYVGDKWLFKDTREPIPANGGEDRPCKKCATELL